MKYFWLIFIVLSPGLWAADGIYLSTSLFPVYGSGNSEAKSSLLGTGISGVGGVRLKNIGFEMGAKRFTTTNKQLGDDKYETEVKDAVFFGGGRFFLSDIFSLKASLSMHYIEMDIYQDSAHLKNDEEDGEYLGLYGGMGIMHPIGKNLDLYYESTLFPVPDIGFYFIDIELGVRIYL